MSHVLTPAAPAAVAPAARRRLPRLSGALWPLAFLGFVLACAVLPGAIAPHEPTAMDADAILAAPGLRHWLGTDQFGRDVFSLLVYGSRYSLLMGACAVLAGGLIGSAIGLLAGYAGPRVDALLMRIIEIWMSVPDILLAIVISTVLGPGLENTILAVGLVTVPRYARVMRSQVLALKGQLFVDAARAIGTPHASILLRHILPHCLSPMLVMATLGVGSSILIGSGLSFLGLGVIEDKPDWGFLMSEGRSFLTVAWWVSTFSGLAITLLVISVNLLGDALRRRVDPHAASRHAR